MLNLVDNGDSDVANMKYGAQRMIECEENGNLHAMLCWKIIECSIELGP